MFSYKFAVKIDDCFKANATTLLFFTQFQTETEMGDYFIISWKWLVLIAVIVSLMYPN